MLPALGHSHTPERILHINTTVLYPFGTVLASPELLFLYTFFERNDAYAAWKGYAEPERLRIRREALWEPTLPL